MPVSDPEDRPLDDAKEFMRRGQRRLAVELLEPWLADYPDDADAWSVLAGAYFELEDYPRALEAARRAAELKPQSARNWCNLGMVLRRTGRLYEAEKAQYRALTIDSDYERARKELTKIDDIRTGKRKVREHLRPM
ncbi:MAG: tetratricopeptide repeat protein [Armatimonadota bacterium]